MMMSPAAVESVKHLLRTRPDLGTRAISRLTGVGRTRVIMIARGKYHSRYKPRDDVIRPIGRLRRCECGARVYGEKCRSCSLRKNAATDVVKRRGSKSFKEDWDGDELSLCLKITELERYVKVRMQHREQFGDE